MGGDVCSRTGLLLTAEVSVRAETDLGTVVILVAAKECFKLITHLPEAARRMQASPL
jgi:hypothetical protein